MSRQIVIKRYGNRRLYDGVEGRYVTIEDLRRLRADAGISVVVEDAQDGRNITDEILATRH